MKVVYARASDQPNHFDTYADLIQETVRGLVERFHHETNGAKLLKVDLGTSCGPQFVDIRSIVLPGPLSTYRYNDYSEFGTKGDAIFQGLRSSLGLGPFPGATGGLNNDYLAFME